MTFDNEWSLDTVTCVPPSSTFSRKTGDLLNSLCCLPFSSANNVNNNNGRLFKRLPVLLENKLDGGTHITVSILDTFVCNNCISLLYLFEQVVEENKNC